NPKTLLFFNKSESYSETTTYIFNIFLYQLTTYQNALKEKQTPEIAGQLFATLQDMKSFLSQISTVGGEPPEGLKQLLESLQNEIKTLTPTPNFKISSSNKETPKKPKSSSANPSLEVTPNTSSPKPRDYFCEIQKLFAQIEQKPHSKNDALTKLVDEMQTNVCFSDVLNQLKENQENTPAYKNIFYLQTILNVTTLSPLNAALTHLALAGLYYDQTKFYLSEWHLNQIPQTVLAELPDITHLRNTIKEEIGKKEPLLTERQRSDLPYHIKNALIQSIKDVTKLENPSFIENSLSRVSSSLSFDTTTPIILNIFLWQLTKYQGAFDDNPNSADQIYTALEDAKELLSSFNKTLFTEKNPPAKLTTLSKTLETCLEKSLGEPLDFSDLLPKNKTFNRNLNSED
ncbi:MAG: hypothetical protein JSS53_05195, partial [Proteobacteria bacterium]|nr:hypothetical protein [Pseudomonadota bacterium]